MRMDMHMNICRGMRTDARTGMGIRMSTSMCRHRGASVVSASLRLCVSELIRGRSIDQRSSSVSTCEQDAATETHTAKQHGMAILQGGFEDSGNGRRNEAHAMERVVVVDHASQHFSHLWRGGGLASAALRCSSASFASRAASAIYEPGVCVRARACAYAQVAVPKCRRAPGQ